MATITLGSSVTLDETSDLQNATSTPSPAGDANDNDALLTSAAFPAVYGVLSAFGSVAKTALSGYTGAAGNTGSNAFTVSPETGAAITGVSFVDSNGNPLSGLDSGLLTSDGTKIFLYTGTDNNVVLGRVGLANGTSDPAGAIAFAGYIEETLTNGAITGGKIWLTEYQPLKHPDTTNPDDAISLSGKVYVGVSQDQSFSLAGAPSGQQLFMMFTTEGATADETGRIPGVSIIVTGKDPLNQSDSTAAITSGDTVNSSQGGGNTTLGSNSQAITEQEGLRFSFVTGAKADYTIPNLSPGEAGLEADIDFLQYFGARSATFQVVQETGGKTATIKLSAFNNADNLAGSQSGVNFIDSYGNDASEQVSIMNGSVTVKSFAGATISSAIITYNTDGSVLITGVPTDSQITYTTNSDHNRVLIENAGALDAKASDKTHADFDIGGFRLLQTSTANQEVGSLMVFEDDGPSITVTQTVAADALTVDETDLTLNAQASFADNFGNTPIYGADGAAVSNPITSAYTLAVSTSGADSGLDDVATGANVLLYLESGVVVGRAGSASGAIVFTVGVSTAGVVTLDQQRALVHPVTTNPDDSVSPVGSNLITLTRTDTITDKDGDTNTDSKSIDITAALSFKDDGPTISVTGTEPTLTVDETTLTTDDTQSFAANFTSAFGADGAGTLTYALGVVAGASGLVDTATNEAVNLSINSGVVEGRTASTNLLVFKVSVDTSGVVTLDQQRAVVHSPNTGPDQSTTLSADNLVTLTATKTDKDGDSAQATLNIGNNLVFKDDAPSIVVTVNAAADALTVDETNLATNAQANYADNFGNTPTFGADGAASANSITSAYTLAVSTSGVDSGLDDVATGANVLLYLESGVVVGRAGSASGAIVFTVGVTTAGVVTLDQQRALVHPVTTNPDDSVSPVGSNLITLTRTDTITDKDGDTNTGSKSIDLTAALSFNDDGPSLSFGNLVGTGTDLSQYGFWSKAAGADGPNAADLQITLNGFQLNGVSQTGGFSLSEAASSPDGNGNYNWTGSLTGDFDNNAATPNTTMTFTLIADPTTGNYALTLATPVVSEIVTDTANGALGAGGPDAVQTLYIPPAPAIPKETVVFFSAKIGTVADGYLGSTIASTVITGASDPSETDLQGANPPSTYASVIDLRSMNVSTSGIGVDNNNLNGYGASGANAVIDDPDGTGKGPADESFVLNPATLVDKVRVFIDNSVTGYDYTGGERLQYRVVYDDGSVSAYQTVVGDLGKGTAPKYFEIDGGAKKIDAVQLTMLYGEIKVPNIQFITETEGLAKDIGLDFTASLTDKDGDTVSTNFSADLFTNKAAGSTYDYELVGTAGAPDAFNVDLATTRSQYGIISGFDTTAGARDKIVLIGDATASVSITNGPDATDNSIVLIDEGGQITTLTVVGVDLQTTDVIFG